VCGMSVPAVEQDGRIQSAKGVGGVRGAGSADAGRRAAERAIASGRGFTYFGDMGQRVEAEAWRDPDTVGLARGLLGRWLCVCSRDGTVQRRRITETEAYHGPDDQASHASRGRTPRNAVMFGPGGVWYVYLCYGMHEMLNLVTGPEEWPAAVLIRGVEGWSGPGRVTRALGIDRSLTGRGLTRRASGGVAAWIEEGEEPWPVPRDEIVAGPRIGVAYAGPEWAAKPWRFRWMTRWDPPRSRRESPIRSVAD